MSFEAPGSNIEVRFEDHMQLIGGGCNVWWFGGPTVMADLFFNTIAIKNSNIIKVTLLALQLEVCEHQADVGVRGGPDQPVALRIVGVIIRVVRAGNNSRKASEHSSTDI